MTDLEPLHPSEAVDMYLSANPYGHTNGTLSGQKYRLRAFVRWCEETGVSDLSELSGRDLFRYRVWRSEGQGENYESIKKVTLRGQLASLRKFLKFAANVDAVPPELHDKVELPTVSVGDDVSDTTLSPDRIPAILAHLEKYQYASRDHVTVLLLWRTGCRIGGLRALDFRDLDLDAEDPRFDGPAVHFVHRPDTGTPLKNAEQGSRWNRISEHTAAVVRDYIDGVRPATTDEDGREPLLATTHGRASISTIRTALYRVTRPCWRGEECPHDRDPDECEATHTDHASKCPSSRSPHDVRSGRVTDYRSDGVPRRVVQDQLDASEDVLDRHYDRRGEREKAEQRSNHLPDL